MGVCPIYRFEMWESGRAAATAHINLAVNMRKEVMEAAGCPTSRV
jgi:hypothetical protein